jgi:CheY-like chemotaxis protein
LHVVGAVEDGIVVQADPLAIDRVLNNLLDNAVKYTPPPGRISVTVSRKGKRVLLAVADSGRGIAAEELPRIFRPYHQVSAKKRSLQGIGMGLAIVNGIVRGAGGRIRVESEEGRGSCFTVSLRPAPDGVAGEQTVGESIQPSVSTPGDAVPVTHTRPGVPSVLVVEDNADLRRLVCRELAMEYSIEEHVSAESALARLAAGPLPDLVVSDVMLDGLDGFAFFERLSAEERTRSIPFIFLTARGSLDDRLRGLGEGALD